MKKKVVLYAGIIVLAVMAILITVVKQRGFGYSAECGIYKVVSTYEDVPEEYKDDYSEDYECRVIHLDLKWVLAFW